MVQLVIGTNALSRRLYKVLLSDDVVDRTDSSD